MKSIYVVSLITFVALMCLVNAGIVAANNLVTIHEVRLNGINITSGSNIVAGESGEVVPISIYFTANENASEVEISAWIQGHRDEAVEKDFKDLIEGKDYIGRLSLKLPEDIDPEEELTLYVRIETDAGNWEESYTVGMQRKPYEAAVLFVSVDKTIEAGRSVPVDVVIKNLGRHDLDDLIVRVGIPELGISKSAYFGDLTPTDKCTIELQLTNSTVVLEGEDCDDNEDARERRIYLDIPENVDAGVYELVVEAYNSKTSESVKENVAIVGTETASNVLIPVSTKEVETGKTTTYDLIIVNPTSKIGVYEIIPETVEGVIVTVPQPIVTVTAGGSKTVQVRVTAGSKEGTYPFSLDINSNNQLIKKVTLTANVTEKVFASNVTILTIVLAIIFVVLLIVLIVLLTRKPRTEEPEESYY